MISGLPNVAQWIKVDDITLTALSLETDTVLMTLPFYDFIRSYASYLVNYCDAAPCLDDFEFYCWSIEDYDMGDHQWTFVYNDDLTIEELAATGFV